MVIGIRVFVHFFCFFGKRVSCMILILILPRINGDRSEWHLLRFFGLGFLG